MASTAFSALTSLVAGNSKLATRSQIVAAPQSVGLPSLLPTPHGPLPIRSVGTRSRKAHSYCRRVARDIVTSAAAEAPAEAAFEDIVVTSDAAVAPAEAAFEDIVTSAAAEAPAEAAEAPAEAAFEDIVTSAAAEAPAEAAFEDIVTSAAAEAPAEAPAEAAFEDIVTSAAAEAPAEAAFDLPEAVKTLQDAWNRIEEKYAMTSLAAAGFIGLWASSGAFSAVDRLPLVPSVFELVGIGYSGWFAYCNVVFKDDRQAMIAKIKSTYSEITGSS